MITGTEKEIQTNVTGWKAQEKNHTPMVSESSTKWARIYNGEKIVSSISDAGKSGQLHVKKKNRIFFNIIHKNKLKMD